MKFPTTIKKYRITDYSQLSDDYLFEQMEYFSKKFDSVTEKRMNNALIMNMFSIFLNMHNLSQEIFRRYPQFRDTIEFNGEIDEILKKNSIKASQN